MSLPSILEARLVDEQVLQLSFSDGRSGAVDFASLIKTDLPSVFASLQDPATFAVFTLANGTLHWPGDLDLAPEYLYFRAFAHEPSLQRQFADWGYLEQQTVHA